MPYTSKAQMRYFHANKKKLENQGVSVDEWDKASEGKKLPERKGKTKTQKAVAMLKRGMAGKKR